jgi:peptidoglycan/LPS O-acetylase OafA/YrhL
MNYKFQGVFRFLLALMVLWSHTFVIFFPKFDWFNNFQFGNVAVASFFVLSGYLMHSAIKNIYFDKLNNFILNRYLRISPPFLIAAFFSISIHYILNYFDLKIFNGENYINYDIIFTTSNISYSIFAPFFPIGGFISRLFFGDYNYVFVGYSWAIYAELMFYWLIWLYYKLSNVIFNKILKITFIIVLITFSILSIVPSDLSNLDPLFFKKIYIFQWTPHFLLGTILANKTTKYYKVQFYFLFIFSIIQIGIYAKSDYINVISLYLIVNIIGFLIINSEKETLNIYNFTITKKIDKYFGNLSYPIYLNHFAISLLFFSIPSKYLILNLVSYIFFNVSAVCISYFLIRITDSFTDSLRDKTRGVKFD